MASNELFFYPSNHTPTEGCTFYSAPTEITPSSATPKTNVLIDLAKDSNTSATRNYNAYKIFNGDVATDGKMSNLAWSSDNVKNIIMGKLTPLGLSTTANAQQAAEFLREKLGDTNNKTILAKDNIGMEIAQALQSLAATTKIPVGTQTKVENGYYVMTAEAFTTQPQNVMASSPIFTVVGGEDLNITEKSSLPTLELKIKEDSTGLWGKVADHAVTDVVDYRMIATLPQNFKSFDNYNCYFELSGKTTALNNLEYINLYLDKDGDGNISVADKIALDILDTIFTQNIIFEDSSIVGNLHLPIYSLSSIEGVTSNSKIIVDFGLDYYKNELGISGFVPSNKREIKAELVYTSNPVNPAEYSSTVQDIVYDYSYNMRITKQDKATFTLLPNAQFTIKTKDGKYLNYACDAVSNIGTGDIDAGDAIPLPDEGFGGTIPDDEMPLILDNEVPLADITSSGNIISETTYAIVSEETTPYIWTTDNNGVLGICGIDADEYIIEEVTAPDSYTKLSAPFKTTIKADYTNPLSPVISTSLTEADTILVSLTTTTDFAADIIVKNIKNLNLPFTGEQGIVMLVIFGSVLVVIGAGTYLRKRRRLDVDVHSME